MYTFCFIMTLHSRHFPNIILHELNNISQTTIIVCPKICMQHIRTMFKNKNAPVKEVQLNSMKWKNIQDIFVETS